jgi:hypothetical protein
VVAPEPSVDLGQALLSPLDRPREPPAAGHVVRELLGQFRALLPPRRALVVEADHSPRISLKTFLLTSWGRWDRRLTPMPKLRPIFTTKINQF